MRDYFLPLAFLFSLTLHGLIASFLMLSSSKISQKEPFTIEVKWRDPSHPISEKILHLAPMASSQTTERISTIQKATKRRNCTRSQALRKDKGAMVRKSSSRALEKGVSIQKVTKKLDCHQGQTSRNDNDRVLQRKSFQPLPKYPWICRKRGQEGQVCLAVQMNEEGRVIRAHLYKSSGHAPLDQSALNAVKNWVFSGGTGQKKLIISFRLKA